MTGSEQKLKTAKYTEDGEKIIYELHLLKSQLESQLNKAAETQSILRQ